MLFGFTAADPHDHCVGQRDFLLQLRFTDAGFADDDDPFPRPAQCGFEMRADCVDREFTLRPTWVASSIAVPPNGRILRTVTVATFVAGPAELSTVSGLNGTAVLVEPRVTIVAHVLIVRLVTI